METKWYLVQQSRRWFVIESASMPDLSVPHGDKRKKLRGTYPDRETALKQGRFLAAHEMGEFVE